MAQLDYFFWYRELLSSFFLSLFSMVKYCSNVILLLHSSSNLAHSFVIVSISNWMLVSSFGIRNLGTVGLGVIWNSWGLLWGHVHEKMCSPIVFFSVDCELPLSPIIPLLPIWLAINSNPFAICWVMYTICWVISLDIYSNRGFIILRYSIFSLV